MLERALPVLKILCAGLGMLVAFQITRLVMGNNPLADVAIPTLRAEIIPAKAPKDEKKTTNSVSLPPPATAPSTVSAAAQARIDRITQSEILAPVIRPLPMALLGVAGKDAFLRAPNGQTGLLREGEELGGVKLLRIGTNRALIEYEGQKQELTIFSGYGSETLLPKGKETSP